MAQTKIRFFQGGAGATSGTWTPNLYGGASAFGHTTKDGYYYVMGNLCYITARIVTTNSGNPTSGTVIILPQVGTTVPPAAAVATQLTVGLHRFFTYSSTATNKAIAAQFSGASGQIDLYWCRDDATSAVIDAAHVKTNSAVLIYLSGVYPIAAT